MRSPARDRLLLGAVTASVLIAGCRGGAPPPPGVLVIEAGPSRTSLTSTELLKRADAVRIVVPDSPVYPSRPFEFRAVPLDALLSPEEIPGTMHVRFVCGDGFQSSIIASRALSSRPGGSRAYLAIDDPERPWPPVDGKPDVRPGPFFLIWTNPSADRVLAEEWPYQIARIQVVPAPDASYPHLNPAAEIAAGDPIRKGFGLFTRLCLPCHTLNGEGPSTIGPDLNLPMSPTDYFRDGVLGKYVRDPRSVRVWPGQRMPAFSKEDLPEEDLAALESYLRHMAARRGEAGR
jgi:mono/diheme cytochrome c family protein